MSLGDIEVYSALNQPLEAEIILTSVRTGETDGMLIKLASEEAFAQAGVERPFYLTKIKFQVASKPDGTQYILATTDNPVREPFLSFLIDIDWPRGHLVREYTVLLDPPVFTNTDQIARRTVEQETEVPTQELPAVSAATESTAGEPALIQRDVAASEAAALEADLPDIEMAEDAAVVTDPALADAATEAAEPSVAEAAAAEQALFEDMPQEMPEPGAAPVADADIPADASLLSERLEQQSLPDIGFEFDEALPYDLDKTNAMLAEFGIATISPGFESSAPSEPTQTRADTYEVQAGDTLWEIASQHKDADVSVQQAMLAILRYNPDAFIRNNINNVKKGFVLRMPERQAMLEISRQEAISEAQRQYALWREYRGELAGTTAGAPQDAAAADRLTRADTVVTDSTATGQLSILAPGRDAESTTRSSGAQEGEEKGSAVNRDLQLAREDLEGERLEKAELESRLIDLNGQIDKMQRLLTLKDEQLAKLQSRLRELEAQAAAPATSSTPPAESLPTEPKETAAPVEADDIDQKTAVVPPADAVVDSPQILDNAAAPEGSDVAGTPPQPATNNDTQIQNSIEQLQTEIFNEIPLQEQPADTAKPAEAEPSATAKPA
ncbi:MAG TPA: FimV/HubP family polar landmark protein, partial [Gammaproteobacteria bacterium]